MRTTGFIILRGWTKLHPLRLLAIRADHSHHEQSDLSAVRQALVRLGDVYRQLIVGLCNWCYEYRVSRSCFDPSIRLIAPFVYSDSNVKAKKGLTAKRFFGSGHQVYRCMVGSWLSIQSESRTILVHAVEATTFLKLVPGSARHS